MPALKNAFLREAKTVKTGTKFIIRDIAQQVGEHTETQFICLRQKQGRDTLLERKGVGVPPNEEERSKEAVKSLIGQFFQVFVYLWPIICFLFPHLPCPRTLPSMRVQLFSKMDSSPEAYRGAWLHLFWGGVPAFCPPRSLSVLVQCLPCSKDGKYVTY